MSGEALGRSLSMVARSPERINEPSPFQRRWAQAPNYQVLVWFEVVRAVIAAACVTVGCTGRLAPKSSTKSSLATFCRH
jgi:hypothetical protein